MSAMSKDALTQCPHCETSFRIEPEQLAIADGNVRCGSCYQVFNANEADTNDSPAKPPETPANSDTKPEASTKNDDCQAGKNAPLPSADDIARLDIAQDSIEQLVAAPTSQRNWRPLLWSLLSLAALLILVGQYFWFNKTYFAQQPGWRPIYQQVCAPIGCSIPAYENLSLIKAERLSLRSNAKYQNVLTVDMILSNSARYRQPLPALLLEFYDLNENTVAQRIFQPGDYLNGSSQKRKHLSPQRNLHLSFDIIDPDVEAANYSLTFIRAQQP